MPYEETVGPDAMVCTRPPLAVSTKGALLVKGIVPWRYLSHNATEFSYCCSAVVAKSRATDVTSKGQGLECLKKRHRHLEKQLSFSEQESTERV